MIASENLIMISEHQSSNHAIKSTQTQQYDPLACMPSCCDDNDDDDVVVDDGDGIAGDEAARQ